jgi:hypothetical protein
MHAFALVELGDSEAIELFLREEDARRALEEILGDEPQCVGLLCVEAIELDERAASANQVVSPSPLRPLVRTCGRPPAEEPTVCAV